MTRRRKQNIKLALVCAILGAIVLMTIFAPWLAPYDPLEVNMELRLLDPCRAHPLGTDALGRDVLSRVIDRSINLRHVDSFCLYTIKEKIAIIKKILYNKNFEVLLCPVRKTDRIKGEI